ncbi:hypothetical protein [Micromonospora chersina]
MLQRRAVTGFTNVYRRSPVLAEARVAVKVKWPTADELREQLRQFLTWF